MNLRARILDYLKANPNATTLDLSVIMPEQKWCVKDSSALIVMMTKRPDLEKKEDPKK